MLTQTEIDTAVAALLAHRARLGEAEKSKSSIESEYGGRTRAVLEASAPPEWDLGVFRQVREGEYYLGASDGRTVHACTYGWGVGLWRIICTRKPPAVTVESAYHGRTLEELTPKLEVHLPLMEKGKPVVREPLPYEWFLTTHRWAPAPLQNGDGTAIFGPRLILQPRRRLVFPVIGVGVPCIGQRYYNGTSVYVSYGTDEPACPILGPPTFEDY